MENQDKYAKVALVEIQEIVNLLSKMPYNQVAQVIGYFQSIQFKTDEEYAELEKAPE